MSSTLRIHRQIGAREKFLIGVVDTSVNLYPVITGLVNGVTVINLDDDAVTSAFTEGAVVKVKARSLLRDMGREVNLYSGGLRTSILREVQPVNGDGTEGVNATGPGTTYLVPVWIDITPDNTPFQYFNDSFTVQVARVG